MHGAKQVAVTGMGVVTSIGRDVPGFTGALRNGTCGVSWLRRIPADRIPIKVGAEILDFDWQQVPGLKPGEEHSKIAGHWRKILNRAPDSTRLSACAAAQALGQSQLLDSSVPVERIGLIVAGSNLHQRHIHENSARFQEEPEYISPTYALSFLDTTQIGCLSELFGLHGMGYTVGGASASGNVALFNAWQWIRAGILDACVVVGASADFSEVELQAFSILGAACGEPYNTEPARACRPFDRDRSGFVFGEGSGCVVLESVESARRRDARVLGEIRGASLVLDGNSLANPGLDGEIKAMRMALREANVCAGDIGYVNAHGSASGLGDQVECEALVSVFGDSLQALPINSTKSLTGHCMFAAGVIEFIASLIQVNEGFLHPNLNLENPLDRRLKFAGPTAEPLAARLAISNGFGFGGFNSSLIVGNAEAIGGA